MISDNQNGFIRKIRSALGKSFEGTRHENSFFNLELAAADRDILDRIENRTRQQRLELLEQCVEVAGPINLEVRPAADVSAVTADIVELVRTKEPEWGDSKQVTAWDHPLLARLNLTEALKVQEVPFVIADLNMAGDEDSAQSRKRRIVRQQIIDAFIGITSADFCMADSATLVLRTRPGQARAVSILPSIHIAVITLEQVIADLRELVAILKWDSKEKAKGLTNCMTFISGPSKTADIEATMVHGAHGPREVYLYVITNER